MPQGACPRKTLLQHIPRREAPSYQPMALHTSTTAAVKKARKQAPSTYDVTKKWDCTHKTGHERRSTLGHTTVDAGGGKTEEEERTFFESRQFSQHGESFPERVRDTKLLGRKIEKGGSGSHA